MLIGSTNAQRTEIVIDYRAVIKLRHKSKRQQGVEGTSNEKCSLGRVFDKICLPQVNIVKVKSKKRPLHRRIFFCSLCVDVTILKRQADFTKLFIRFRFKSPERNRR